jgi:hypothetical protein
MILTLIPLDECLEKLSDVGELLIVPEEKR